MGVKNNLWLLFPFLLLMSGCIEKEEENNISSIIEFNEIKDLDVLFNYMYDKEFVLLGESTHGTQEYYELRSYISKRLIEDYDFKFIAVEGDWNLIYELNLYIKGLSDKNNAKEILEKFDRWPQWIWANEEIRKLSEWLKNYNDPLPLEKKVGFYGFDVYNAEKSLLIVEDILKLKYDCMSLFSEDFSSYAYFLSLGNHFCEDAKDVYYTIKENISLKEELGHKDYFYLKQNAFVVKGAEKHYRGMVYSNMSSWNERVIHMNITLAKLIEKENGKGIVWAHNTHVGDARATDMIYSGSINIGQLMREADVNIFILGFGTYMGEVIAGKAWGANMEKMIIPKAHPSSYEYLFKNLGMNQTLIIFGIGNISEDILEKRNNRAIGVVYNSQYEYPGNYVWTDLKERYDSFIFIRETNALELLS
jgi:erythromycin esterase